MPTARRPLPRTGRVGNSNKLLGERGARYRRAIESYHTLFQRPFTLPTFPPLALHSAVTLSHSSTQV
jgi:hypothetical protein